MEQTEKENKACRRVAVIGAGPAGLFASERLLAKGFAVALYDGRPSPGRKFLLAGTSGGLNITNAADPDSFAARYGASQKLFESLLADFSPTDLVAWLNGFGIAVTHGSGGKIFPDVPVENLLEAWLRRLAGNRSFSLYPEWKFEGFARTGVPLSDLATIPREGTPHVVLFSTPEGPKEIAPDAVLFALGGASWPATGSDGSWVTAFSDAGIRVDPLIPANCGFETDWPPPLAEAFPNVPLKNITVSCGEKSVRGEMTLTPYGIEGGPIYALGASIRNEIAANGKGVVTVDLMPDWTQKKIAERLSPGPGKESLSNFYRKRLALGKVPFALLRQAAAETARMKSSPSGNPANLEVNPNAALRDPENAARLVKAVPIALFRPRPIAEAISSAGGISLEECDENIMLKKMPGVFCAGEMLSWEAPTGGFLLQGCFSTAYRTAEGAVRWLSRESKLLASQSSASTSPAQS